MVQKQPILGNTSTAKPIGREQGLPEESEDLGWDGRTPEPLEAEQFQPMRMLLPGHEFGGAFARALGPPASCKGAVIHEEAQQV